MSGIPPGAGSLLGKRLGKYEILALLALGGTAEIYLARIGGHAGFEKYVVVKCLHDHLADDPEFVKMFLDEARLAAHLDHSNIVQTFELGEHENRYYMVMEFLAGLSLAMVVRRAQERLSGGRIPVPLILNIAAQACAGLHYAHERAANGKPLNIVHRDISPQNLVISFEGVVRVVDFGIARAEMRETKTKAGTIKGKFAYMSPEQCVATNVDRRTDVFALGVILWELLTGRRLFKRNSPYETYQAVIACDVPAPSTLNHELDAELDAIVMKAVAKEKEQRYATAEALGDALQGYLHHRGKGSGPADIARWFDQHFGQEIEEHGERMRELISAGNASVDTGMGWGDEEEEKRANETVDLGAKKTSGKLDAAMAEGKSIELTGGDLEMMGTGDSSLDEVIGDIGDDGGGDGDDDEELGGKTRIEMNPYSQLEQMNAASRTPVPTGSVTGAEPLPAPPVSPGPAGKPPGENRTVLGVQQPAVLQQRLSAQRAATPSSGAPVARPSAAAPVARPSAEALPTTYPVVSGRPMSSDLAPARLPNAQASPYANKPFEPPAIANPAANLMSPVGPGFPQTDWAAAAAQPAKALPRWMLAALFAGALVGALLLTFLIALILK